MSANTSFSSPDVDEVIVCKVVRPKSLANGPPTVRQNGKSRQIQTVNLKPLLPSSSGSSVHIPRNFGKSCFEAFENKLSGMGAEHKSCLKKLRQEERANNEAFFALVTYQKTRELPSSDNTTVYLPVIHGGINLKQIPAKHSAAKLG